MTLRKIVGASVMVLGIGLFALPAIAQKAPPSTVDEIRKELLQLPYDSLRWKVYYSIYRDPFLSRYAPGGGMLWGHRHAFASDMFLALGPTRFPGTEPAGDYPIHIIVKGSRIILLGVVDSEADKTVANMRAREVAGSFGVDNEIVVDQRPKKTT